MDVLTQMVEYLNTWPLFNMVFNLKKPDFWVIFEKRQQVALFAEVG